ncbi:phenylacetate--CoA ligase family protein [Thermodesulfobacteriota bacterium]
MKPMKNFFLNLADKTGLSKANQYAKNLRKVRKLMKLDKKELEQFQLNRLKEIVHYSYENVALYRRKWNAAGVSPDDIQSLKDIKKLPITTKDDFRHNYPSDILSKTYKAKDCYLVGTSGSTGSPVNLFVDEDKLLLEFATSLPKIMADMPEISITKAVKDFIYRRNIANLFIVADDLNAMGSAHGRMFWAMKHTIVSAYKSPEFHIEEINKRKPKYIFTYPSVIRNLLIIAKEKRIKIHQPTLIMLCGENLDTPLRDSIKTTFGSELLDFYASTELGHIASECLEHQGMHLFPWKVITEILNNKGDEAPAGTPGRVIVTDLFSKATPIIRYSGLNDYAVRKKELCSCGRSSPLLERIEGRIVDSILLPDKKIIHPFKVTTALEDIPHISKFQIRQERMDYIKILIVKDSIEKAKNVSFDPDSTIGKKIIRRFNRILNNQVKIDIETVEDIPKVPGSHKYATVLSLVKGERPL